MPSRWRSAAEAPPAPSVTAGRRDRPPRRAAGRRAPGLVRHGVEQGQVTAVFDVPKGHPASVILSDNGLDDTGEMILRRVQLADGRTRAFINDQAVSVQTLQAVGSALGEMHATHAD